MNKATRFGLFVIAFMTVNPVCAQVPDLSDVSIVTTAISDGVYMLEATGDVAGNIAVSVGEDGILIDFVRTRRARGLSLDAVKAEGFPTRYDDWGYGYISASEWIEMIYRSLD
jgi:hypothetical protein